MIKILPKFSLKIQHIYIINRLKHIRRVIDEPY